MSAIAGILSLEGKPVDPALLTAMTNCVVYRGPDGEGHWMDGRVGLGHRLLATTPESLQASQPVVSESGERCLTFDGRLDNRDELRKALQEKGIPSRTATDPELILSAYGCWGESCVRKILGDFAFAIWDTRRQTLFCARDPLGIKPFHYFSDGKKFLWASEIKQIFQDATVPHEPNFPLIGDYLMENFSEQEETLYRGIHRLPPAHYMVLKNGELRKERYWDVDPGKEIRYQADEEYADHFLHLFQEAVRCRLRSRGPVGAYLSGGLDSSSIVCMAEKIYRENGLRRGGFETFSNVFDQFPCDERAYIREVARAWGTQSNYFLFEGERPSWQDISCYHDIFYNPTLFMARPILESARRKGMSVLLDGLGGDHVATGSTVYGSDLLRRLRVREALRYIHHNAARYGESRWGFFLHSCLRPLVPPGMKSFLKIIFPFLGGTPTWVTPSFRRRARLREWQRHKTLHRKLLTHCQQEMYQGIYCGYLALALDMLDRFGSAHSIESRYPFLDCRLMEFFLAIPEEQLQRGGQTKFVLRRAMNNIVPEAILSRHTKADFSEVFDDEWMRVHALIRSSALASAGIIDGRKVEEAFQRFRKGERDRYRWPLSLVVNLELWYRKNFLPDFSGV